MKTLIAFAICLSGAFFASSCGKNPEEEAAAKLEKISVSLEQGVNQLFDSKKDSDTNYKTSVSFDMKKSDSITNPFSGSISIDVSYLRVADSTVFLLSKCTVNLEWSDSQKTWQFRDASEVVDYYDDFGRVGKTLTFKHDSMAATKEILSRVFKRMTDPDKKILESYSQG